MIALALLSCKGKGGSGDSVENLQWAETDISELQMNPVDVFAKDWMALAAGSEASFNAMTISWGTLGELWNKPVVIVFVSPDRATKKFMDENKYFTVSSFPNAAKDALVYIGSKSYRDNPDKVADAGLHVEFSPLGNPLFKEAELSFECRKIYAEAFDPALLPEEVKPMYDKMAVHVMYIGEIVKVWEKR